MTNSLKQPLVGSPERLQARADSETQLSYMDFSGVQRYDPIGWSGSAAGQAERRHARHGEVKVYELQPQGMHQGIKSGDEAASHP